MQFGLYVTQPNISVGSREIALSSLNADRPLAAGAVDLQYSLAREVLGAADNSGFDIILFAERHLGPDLAAWVMASAIGGSTQRIRSMIAVHPGLWHPTMVAKLAASLDRIARGRIAINIVAGWNREEFAMFGGEIIADDAGRYRRTREFVEILRGLWTRTPFSYDGEFYHVDAAALSPKPATATPPEIYTAARAGAGLEMAAEIADWWFVEFPKDAVDTAELMQRLRRTIADMKDRAARYGRTVKFGFNPFIGFGASAEAATDDIVRRMVEFDPDADGRKMKTRVYPALKAGLIGKPQDVRDQVLRLRDIGVELLLLKFFPTAQDVRRVADEVILPLREKGLLATP